MHDIKNYLTMKELGKKRKHSKLQRSYSLDEYQRTVLRDLSVIQDNEDKTLSERNLKELNGRANQSELSAMRRTSSTPQLDQVNNYDACCSHHDKSRDRKRKTSAHQPCQHRCEDIFYNDHLKEHLVDNEGMANYKHDFILPCNENEQSCVAKYCNEFVSKHEIADTNKDHICNEKNMSTIAHDVTSPSLKDPDVNRRPDVSPLFYNNCRPVHKLPERDLPVFEHPALTIVKSDVDKFSSLHNLHRLMNEEGDFPIPRSRTMSSSRDRQRAVSNDQSCPSRDLQLFEQPALTIVKSDVDKFSSLHNLHRLMNEEGDFPIPRSRTMSSSRDRQRALRPVSNDQSCPSRDLQLSSHGPLTRTKSVPLKWHSSHRSLCRHHCVCKPTVIPPEAPANSACLDECDPSTANLSSLQNNRSAFYIPRREESGYTPSLKTVDTLESGDDFLVYRNTTPDTQLLAEHRHKGESHEKTNLPTFKTCDNQDEIHEQRKHLRESLTTTLSGLYAVVIVVIGSVLSMTESFLTSEKTMAFEVFSIFTYSISIVFLGFVYLFLLRDKSKNCFRTAVRKLSFHDIRPTPRRAVTFTDTGHTGSFYLRLGAIGFGIGGMVLDGLYIAEHFEDSDNDCHPEVSSATYVAKIVFAFSQLYFVFNNAEIKMMKHQELAKFGLMHMTATNICEWYRTVVVETIETLSETSFEKEIGSLTNSSYEKEINSLANVTVAGSPINSSIKDKDHECQWSEMVGVIIKDTSPYLYPFKIEYNLICAGILYVMWRHIAFKSENEGCAFEGYVSRRRRLTVDCGSTSKGLFLGILLFVTVVISLKSFYSLMEITPGSVNVIIISHMTEICLYAMAFTCTIIGAVRMRGLKFRISVSNKLEENLISIAQVGLFLYGLFSIVASFLQMGTLQGILTIVTNFAMILQAATQTVFLFIAMRMCASTTEQVRHKPGREFVTFLLLCNFCMWVVNTFETLRPEHNVVQIQLYGDKAWAIFVHMSVPLGIFYRFHSTVCLSHIWKYAWKMKEY